MARCAVCLHRHACFVAEGLPVALVVGGSMPLERALGVEVGGAYRDLHRDHGVDMELNHPAVGFRGRTSVEAVEIDGGRLVRGDLVVVGIGARPRDELARAAGLALDDGIRVDEYLESSASRIFAAGDVAAAWHPLFGAQLRVEHWDNARRQGRVAARNMLGRAEAYDRIPYFYSDQYDLGMEYVGHTPSWDRVVFRGDVARREFIAFWLEEGRVAAAMNANIHGVSDALAGLVGGRHRVDPDRLADSTVPLEDLVAVPLSA